MKRQNGRPAADGGAASSLKHRTAADGGAASSLKRRTARLAALALAFILALPWTGPARADRSVFFVAADQTVLPLSDDTMPFWQDGFLYISCAVFSDSVGGGAARRNLDISMTQNSDQDKVTLSRGTDFLEFEQGVPFATDQEGTIFYPGAVWRNGRVFVSADLTARFFGLLYSVTAVEHGSLVWLRNPSFRLREEAFSDAAAWQLDNSYEEYISAKLPRPAPPDADYPARPDSMARPDTSETLDRQDRPPTVPVRTEPPDNEPSEPNAEEKPENQTAEPENPTRTYTENPAETESPARTDRENPVETENHTEMENPAEAEVEPPEMRGGVDLYLCLRGGENTAALLDTLDGAGVRAAFFCDRAFLEQEGDLVRRMAASGHSIGLYLSETENRELYLAASAPDTAASAPNTLEAAAETCERILEQTACLRTRLAVSDTEADRTSLRSRGFVCPEHLLDLSETPLRTASRRQRLLREAEAMGDQAALWLGDSVTAEDLGELLDAVQEAENRCLALTESAGL